MPLEKVLLTKEESDVVKTFDLTAVKREAKSRKLPIRFYGVDKKTSLDIDGSVVDDAAATNNIPPNSMRLSENVIYTF